LQQLAIGQSPSVIEASLNELEKLYDGHLEDANWMKGDRSRARTTSLKHTGSAIPATYGEVSHMDFLKLLTELGAVPGQKVYDLGSGTGKLVVLAWLLGFNAIGVELVRERYDASRRILSAALGRRIAGNWDDTADEGMQFIHGDLCAVDFSDADIVFANSVMYTKDLMNFIAQTAEKKCRPGAKLVTTTLLGFEERRKSSRLKHTATISLATSWHPNGTNYIVQTVL